MRATPGRAALVASLLTILVLSGCGGGAGEERSGATAAPIANKLPIASAGADQKTKRNALVTLDGRGSTDPDGDSVAYRWMQTDEGPRVTLSSSSSATPTFTAPNQSGPLTFSLTANDGKTDSIADTVTVVVENHAPIAVMSAPSALGVGDLANLDARASSDPDGDTLTYTWSQLSGPPVTIQGITTGLSQFQVPNAPVVIALTVSDGEATSVTINVTINIIIVTTTNRAPTAMAGTNQVVPRRSLVQLNGSGVDPDSGTVLGYRWEQVSGTAITLVNASTRTPRFTAPEAAGTLRFALRVSDGTLTSAPSEVSIEVRNYAPVVAATLTPQAPYTLDTLRAQANASDLDGDPLTFRYEWRRNGTLVTSQTTDTFPANLTTRNDVIAAKVIATDGVQESSIEATTTILDSAATLSATSPPATLDYGDTASFQLTVADADGDALPSVEVAYGPAGFAISNQGRATWTADGPLFDRETDFSWGVRLIGNDPSLLTGTISVKDANRAYPLLRTGVQIPVQHDGLQIGDFDNNGSKEVLVGSPFSIYILAKTGTTYRQTWAYPFEVAESGSDAATGSVAARDVTGDGRQEIFFSKGDILVRLDGVDRRERVRSRRRCIALELADMDGNGNPELVCLQLSAQYTDIGRVSVLDPVTLAEIWSTFEVTLGRSISIDNVDGDAALEIVTSGGYVFDGATHQNQWAYSTRFGTAVDTGDMDGDGIAEIIGIEQWGTVRAYDAVAKSPLWEYLPAYPDLGEILIADADGDGDVEAIVGNGQWGNVTGVGYNRSSHQPELLWQISSQDHGVTSFAVGDIDGLAGNEIVWGSGASSSGRDKFVVAGFTPGLNIKWQSTPDPQLDLGFIGGQLARVGAGAKRLAYLVPRTNSGYDGARVVLLDPLNGQYSVSPEIGTNWGGSGGLSVVDHDQDGIDEVFIGSANLYNGFFASYDPASNAVEWMSPDVGSMSPRVVAHADITGDGRADLIGGTSDGYVYVYDIHQQTLSWKSTQLQGGIIDIVPRDLDSDGRPELIILTYDRVIVYGRNSWTAPFLERGSRYTNQNNVDLLVADLDGNSTPEFYVLQSAYNGNSTIRAFGAALEELATYTLPNEAAAMAVEDSNHGRKNLAVAVRTSGPFFNGTEVWAIDPRSGVEIWRSPKLSGAPQANSIGYLDADGNGKLEISLGTSNGMYLTR